MKTLAMILGLGLMLFGCTSDGGDGDGGGGTGGAGGSGGSGGTPAGVGPAAPLALECRLLGNDATFPFEFFVDLAEEPVIGQPVDATVTVSLVFSPELSCGILAAGFTSVDLISGEDTVTITGVSSPDPGEVTLTLPGTPVRGLQFADACGCAMPGDPLVPPCGTGPGLKFSFDPETVSVTPDGASTMDFLLTVDGIDLRLANLMSAMVTLPTLDIPTACETAFIGADLDGDEVYSTLATPPLQIQIPVLCDGVDCNDDNECTADACVDGACSSSNVEDGVRCDGGDGLCEEGTCVALLCRGVDCSDGKVCTVDPTCNPANGQCEGGSNKPAGDLCNANGSQGVCDGQGECVGCNDDTDCTVGETECKESLCDNDTSECLPAENKDNGTNCMLVGGAAGMCNEGDCVGFCFDAETRCPQPTAPAEAQCLDNDCDETNGQCLNTPLTGQICELGDPTDPTGGICSATGVCEAAPNCDDAATRCIENADNECVDDTCDPATGECGSANVTNGTSCNSGAGTCQEGVCESIPLTCGVPDDGNVVPCLSEFVLSDDCFVVTGSVPVPTTPIVTPTAPLFDGVETSVFPQIQASLPWPLLCTLAGPAGGGADLKDSALEMVRAGATSDFTTHSYVNPTSPFLPNVETPHGAVALDFSAACQTAQDITVNLFGSNAAGVCTENFLENGGTCVGGTLAGSACSWTSDCYPNSTLDLDDLPGTRGVNQALNIVPSGTMELFGFTHADIAVDLGNVIPGVADNVCIGGACPIYGTGVLGSPIPSVGTPLIASFDTCPPIDRDGDGDGETDGGDDGPRIMYDANCRTADAVAGDCTPFVTGDDTFEVLACDLGTDTTNPNWGQSCTVATAEADCGTGVACTLQTLASLFTSPDETFTASGFSNLSDCCNAVGAGIAAGETPGCSRIPDGDPPRSAACAGLLALYPTATQAQWVQVPVNQ